MTTAELPFAFPRRSSLGLIVCLTALVSALALCANRTHNGDVYLQLLGGRFVAQHGFAASDPFPTIAAGHAWHNQQWLSELVMYGVTRAVGLTGLTVLYALLLGLPLLVLLLGCRDRSPRLLVGGAALYFPALLAILHPRAAALTLVCFSLLTLMIARFARAGSPPAWPWYAALACLFALWANLHGGFVSGLLGIGLVTAGVALDRARGIRSASVVRLALAGAVALAATFATPLGPAIWSYVSSFSNPALTLATTEWEPVWDSAPASVYLVAAGVFAALLHARAPRPRRLMPLFLSAGLLLASLVSLRNLILIPPALFLQLRYCGPARGRIPLRALVPALAGASVAAALAWAFVLGPARTPRYLSSSAVRYALAHRAQGGRVAAIAGVGSYLLWREPRTPVVLDGWLEHFSPNELRADYAIVRGGADAATYAARLRVGAVITSSARAASALEAHGFVVKATSADGARYLVRSAPRR